MFNKFALFNLFKINQQQFQDMELSNNIQGERCRDPTSQEFGKGEMKFKRCFKP